MNDNHLLTKIMDMHREQEIFNKQVYCHVKISHLMQQQHNQSNSLLMSILRKYMK